MMDQKDVNREPNPVLTANPLSRLLFWWLNSLFRKGYGCTLEADDLYSECPSDQSNVLGDQLEREWQKEIRSSRERKTKPRLTRVLFRIFGLEYLLLGLLLVVREAAKISQPLILGRLIRYFAHDSSVTKLEAYMYALAMSLCSLVLVMTFHPYVFHVMRMGMKMRLACNSVMYRKSLRLSSDGLSKTTSGQIINLMSNDVGKFDYAFVRMMYLILGPLDAIVIHILLWQSLGISVLAGFVVLVLLVPLQGLLGKLVSKFTREIAKRTDERVRMMNETISGMQVIKLNCWEKAFGDRVKSIRKLETNQVRKLGYLRAITTGPFFISAKFMALAVFVTFSLVGGVISAEPIFVALSIYESVRLAATSYVCYAITQASEVLVAINRIETFLQLPELDNPVDQNSEEKFNDYESSLELKAATSKWCQTLEHTVLKNITAIARKETLLTVIGPVGAGKSSLLMAILGELPVLSGHVKVNGHVAYVSQQPWVFSGTLQQNITAGNPLMKEKYEKILKACALSKDVAMMPYGDLTLIGDRGIRLSGGQRARINLARAIYTDADIYLLDDPLSAVDAAVGRHIFQHVMLGILKNKTKILVTHQQRFLKYADEILILKQGKIVNKGTYDELTSSGVDLKSFLARNKETEDSFPSVYQSFSSTTPKISRVRRYSRQISAMSLPENEPTTFLAGETEAEEQEGETIQEGAVGWKVYFTYFRAGAGFLKFGIFAIVCLLVVGAYVISDYWLSYWSREEQRQSSDLHLLTNITNNVSVNTYFYVSVYGGLIGGVFLLELIRALLFFRIAVDASKNLHNTMLERLLRTKIGFFAVNPVGRILNRFSKDVGQIDNRIPDLFFNILQCGMMILSMVVVVGVVNPWTFIPVLPICILLVIVRRYFLRTSRDVHRLEGIARSPIYSHVSASLEGLITIRACRIQQRFQEEFDTHQDSHTRAYFLLTATTTWLGMRLDFLSALFLTAVSFCCVLASDSLGPGLVGLTMTYAITGTGIFQWTMKSSADLENQMISVERVRDYSKLSTEAPLETEKKPPSDWPQNGSICAENVYLRYHPDAPNVLKDISFIIKPREKIGIVGRSGAGKSSLITMLFRLEESEGKLTIDDIDVQSLCLHDLRKKISIIPQDPTLFKGKLRSNLDPFGEHDDASVWQVLKEVQLSDSVTVLTKGLETEVEEGGSNFSVGQRQLICLARAILRHNKILVIDEATANVDIRTDRHIQKAIREKFHDYTVLTIAHRLHTVIDSDRIMVLDDGRIVEFDSPHLLLTKKDGLLSKMVRQTGSSETQHLTEEAKAAYDRKIHSRLFQNGKNKEGAESRPKIMFYLPCDERTLNTECTNDEMIVTRL